jgi:hypothetical protein
MGKASRIRREQREQGDVKPPKPVHQPPKPHVLLAYALPKSATHERLTTDVFTLFKYGFVENAATLATSIGDDYVFVLDFLSPEEAERCRVNVRDNASHLLSTAVPSSLIGFEPWATVLPHDIGEEVARLVADDPDLSDACRKGLADRREKEGKGEYVFPDLPDEEYEAVKQQQKDMKIN